MVKEGFLRNRHSYRMELARWELGQSWAEGNRATVRGQVRVSWFSKLEQVTAVLALDSCRRSDVG